MERKQCWKDEVRVFASGKLRGEKGERDWKEGKWLGIKRDMKNDLPLLAFLIYSRRDNEQ